MFILPFDPLLYKVKHKAILVEELSIYEKHTFLSYYFSQFQVLILFGCYIVASVWEFDCRRGQLETVVIILIMLFITTASR